MGKGPLPRSVWKELSANPLSYAGLATSLTEEMDYEAEVVGKLPAPLQGTLYRNGPGLYDRGDHRKRMLLDGDGMVQAFEIGDGRVRYRNRFVLTDKLIAEQNEGRYLFPTWSTLAPGGFLRNWGAHIANQAGVTVIRRGSQLLAFDEGHKPLALNPSSLQTQREVVLDEQNPARTYNAHWKLDSRTGEWLNLCLQYGRNTVAYLTVHGVEGNILRRHQVNLPRSVYMHDWLLSENYFIFILHPAYVSMNGLLRVLSGFDTYSECLRWRPQRGNLICVAPRSPGFATRLFEAPACWMWHALNAFERDGRLFADFVGSEAGVGVSSSLFEVMEGKVPEIDPTPTSLLRRYQIDLRTGTLRSEIVSSDGNFELPFVSQNQRGQPHRYGYAAKSDPGKLFWSSVCRIETDTGRLARFHFGDDYCGEPVFVPNPEKRDGDAGWVLTQCYTHSSRTSYLAILDAEHLGDGPVAKVLHPHHVPLSFHGYWHPAG